jgi:hypothetical protein
MEPEGSLPHSQQLSTCPYSESEQPSPHHPKLSLEYPSQYYPLTYALVFIVVSFPLAFLPSAYPRSSSPHSCYMPSPFHPPRLDHSNYTWRRVQNTKLLVMQSSPTSVTSLFGLNILLSTLFLNTHKLCPSLNVRDQVSHPCRTTGKIAVLYILIFTFFYSRREDRRSWSEW